MKNMIKSPLQKIITLGASSLVFLSFVTVQAITVSPARTEPSADPGQTISDTFMVINDQDQEQTFYTSVEAFESQGETGTPNFTSVKEGLPTWVQVQEKVVLKKGERAKIPYNINVPAGTEPGGYFAAIFLSTQPPSAEEGQVSVGAKVGMLILLKVNGQVKESGVLASFELKEKKSLLTSMPVNFVYRFRNEGNDKAKPEGEIVIKNMLGMEVARLDANKTQGNVLPSSIRRFDIRYGEKDAPAISAPFFDQVSYQLENFAFGMYTANISLSFGNNGKAVGSLTYYMLPWQLMTVVSIVVLITILVLFFLVKRYNQWIIKQARAAAKHK
jgi:hypothetical protein